MNDVFIYHGQYIHVAQTTFLPNISKGNNREDLLELVFSYLQNNSLLIEMPNISAGQRMKGKRS